MRGIGIRASASFRVGDRVFVVRGNALGPLTKRPNNKSKCFSPCHVVSANHRRYGFLSPQEGLSRKQIHARGLIKFTQRPLHLQ